MSARAARDPLIRLLREPARAPELRPRDWPALLVRGRRTGVLARLAILLDEAGVLDAIPAKARASLLEARLFAERNQTTMRFEVNRIARALRGLDLPILLLKGVAYVMADLGAARGRLQSDVDILVPEPALGAVERAMLAAGWERGEVSDYDQHYYRAWMHEIPPLHHVERETVTDVHHTILPRTSRQRPDARALLDAAVALDQPRLQVLCPADMVLHSAVHLFNEEFSAALRDLLDLDDMLRQFSAEDPEFWETLLSRARLHGLERPLFYATRYCARLLGTEIPIDAWARLRAMGPALPIRWLMDLIVPPALAPADPRAPSPLRGIALWLLFVRSHWLKMPPLLLARHLTVKAWRRIRSGPAVAH